MTTTTSARVGFALALLLAFGFLALQGWGATTEVASEGRFSRIGVTDKTDAKSDKIDAAPAAGAVTQANVAQPNAAQANAAQPNAAQANVAQPNAAQANEVTLTLLHNNDGESKLLQDVEGGFPGIARFATAWIEEGRNTDADILLRVTAGDNFLASKEFSAGLDLPADEPLFDSLALRGLYEVMGLGNHDFDFGPDVTARFIEGFRIGNLSNQVPFVAANIDVTGEPLLQQLANEGRIAPSTIYTDPVSGLQVGVIGAVTPRLSNISSPRNVTVDANVANAVNTEVTVLTDQGVDRIVLVSHLQGLTEDQDLVPQLRGVDIVVAGGGDELLKNDGDNCQVDLLADGPYPIFTADADGNDVPIVTAPGGYRCFGRLDVTFNAEGRISGIDGTSIGVPLTGEPEEFALSRVEEPLAAALAELQAASIGKTEVVLDGRRSSVRTAATNVGELVADALLSAGQSAPDFGGEAAVVALQNGGGIRNDAQIRVGEITEADTFDIAPFANFVVTGPVPRERFRDLLEGALSGLPEAEGRFPQIAGFTMVYDTAQPAREIDRDNDCSLTGDPGSRLRTVTLDDGTEIVVDGEVIPGDDIVLATSDFLAGGGDCYPLDDIEFTAIGSSYQQALSSFIVEDLDGTIAASDYPEGGSRSSLVNPDEVDSLTLEREDAEAEGDAADEVEGNAANADGETASQEQLAVTGVESELLLVIALTIAAAGLMIFFEARRAGWLSLSSRLRVTQAGAAAEDEAEPAT